jgi:hypothetical protein
MAADAPDGNEDLVMMRIIGDACEGEPGRAFLVTEVSTHDLHAGFKTMVRLRKIIQEGFPSALAQCARSLYVPPYARSRRNGDVSSSKGILLSPQYSIEALGQVLCQFFVSTRAA